MDLSVSGPPPSCSQGWGPPKQKMKILGAERRGKIWAPPPGAQMSYFTLKSNVRIGAIMKKFSWHLFISCERECAFTDPLAAGPWTPGVLAHLPTSRTVHTVQKKWWSSLKNVANPHFPLCRGPPPSAGSARERTHATSRPAMRLRDRSHAPTNRTRGLPDHIRRQSVTGRR